MSDAASDRLPRGPERRGAVGRTGAVVDAGRRETTRRTYTRNGNLGSDVSVILKETFDMITGDGRSCATRAILEVPSPGSARGPEHECSGLLAIIGTRGYVGTPDTLPVGNMRFVK